MKQIGWLIFILYSSSVLSADEVEIPLLAETPHLQAAVSQVLELDENGNSTLGEVPCNKLELSDLQVATEDAQLTVGMAMTAKIGAEILGSCRGVTPWKGRMALKLTPQVTASGLAIEFVPDSIVLSRPDSKPGMLSKPVQVIVDTLVLPRMRRVKIDLAGPLSGLDELIELLLSPKTAQGVGQSLVQRTHISRIQTEEEGVRAWLAFQVRPPEPSLQMLEPSFNEAEMAEWQTLEDEFDGFLTTIIAMLARSTNSHALRMELLAVLLDARHAISEALSVDNPQSDPIRELFLTTWDRLRPLISELEDLDTPGLEADFRLAGFIAGGDALRALDALGPEYGLEITRDGLRRLARLLLAEKVPPSFTPLPREVDPEFRDLFGFDDNKDDEAAVAVLKRQLAEGVDWIGTWLLSTADAEDISPAIALKGLVPQRDNLNDYLDLVARLLEQQASNWLAENNKLPDRLVENLDPLVRATAWKESCWRQFAGSSTDPQVLRSPVGAVGMMQINGRVWRNVYDLDRLVDEVDYNVNAGIDILTHYLIDYAIRRGEHEQPGGDDNLIKASYSAYNGGPSQLSRYRRDDTPARLQSIDNAFWNFYTTFKDGQLPDIAGCYVVGN